jgi:molybdenum cofactor cytidylyltransferase
VTGANAEQVETALHDLNVLIVRNNNWQSGQGSSVREGLRALSSAPAPGGVVFLLADQPQVTHTVIQALREKHAEGLYPIVAPLVMDRRANPVLFDRSAFPDLLTIEGDSGGRAIFHKHRVEYLPWYDDRLLLDVDTPEQYEHLLANRDL